MDEIKDWYLESKIILKSNKTSFSVLIDMTRVSPLGSEAKQIMLQGQKMYKDNGMVRSVVLVDQVLEALQFKILAMERGINITERYIATESPNAQKKTLDWLVKGIEPDTH